MNPETLTYWTTIFSLFAAILSVPKAFAEMFGLLKQKPAVSGFKK